MSRYERVLFADVDCSEFMSIYDDSGARALFEHCTQWHYPGEHETSDELSAHRDRAATHYQYGAYTLSVCSALDYVSLEFDTLYYPARRIERLYAVIAASLFGKGTLSYDRLTEALTRLANAIADYDGDDDFIWYIGEFELDSMPDMIAAAYWHYCEWHAGQFTDTYRALSALGGIYSPGMESADEDSATYQHLDTLARTK